MRVWFIHEEDTLSLTFEFPDIADRQEIKR